MARDVNGNKKDSSKYVSSKRKTGENVGPLLNRSRGSGDRGHAKG